MVFDGRLEERKLPSALESQAGGKLILIPFWSFLRVCKAFFKIVTKK
jgi:hypothetical protein